ncbi:fibroblast growth factor receptor 3-like [Anneissia japonica]|uniref:fibroblast growth factor receptor 3-like n=1 Tax=Anneissia japonica TaxID=1529436 RepID=UPI001425A2F9|nr:fibroblast growth factor receptor 3-like [Anneissia japonica]
MPAIFLIIVCICGVFHLTSAQSMGCENIPSHPVINGKITYTPSLQNYIHHGTRAEYVCHPGYTNVGPQIVIYCHDGTWIGLDNDDPTKCVPKSSTIGEMDCQNPEDDYLRPNLVQTGSYKHEDTVEFECVPGYQLHPASTKRSHCINGGWTQPAPDCVMEGSIPSPITTTEKDGVEREVGSSSSSSAGVIVAIVVPIIIILMIIAFLGFRKYKSRTDENRPAPPPPIWCTPNTAQQIPPPRMIDESEGAYSHPNAALTSRDVNFDTPVDGDCDNTYNVTIRLEGNRQQNAVGRVIHGNFSIEDKEAMEREIEAIFRLPFHYGVIRPIAEINEDDMIGIFTERAPKGSLWSYLRSFADARNSVKPKARELINYALQIAEAMKFLHDVERVCPLLSCRQIMLFRDNICKIPIIGLKRLNDNTDLYRFGDTTLPVRWMAPESIDYQIFTKSSDVWAFGVVLYEIITLGETPYEGMTPEAIPGMLNQGYRLEKPQSCGRRLYEIMENCWQQEPRDRPSFEELVAELRELKNDTYAICFGPDYIERPLSRNPFSAH